MGQSFVNSDLGILEDSIELVYFHMRRPRPEGLSGFTKLAEPGSGKAGLT